MGLIFALPCDQEAPEHADRATITHLPQLPIDAELLHYVITHQSTLLAQLNHKHYLLHGARGHQLITNKVCDMRSVKLLLCKEQQHSSRCLLTRCVLTNNLPDTLEIDKLEINVLSATILPLFCQNCKILRDVSQIAC